METPEVSFQAVIMSIFIANLLSLHLEDERVFDFALRRTTPLSFHTQSGSRFLSTTRCLHTNSGISFGPGSFSTLGSTGSFPAGFFFQNIFDLLAISYYFLPYSSSGLCLGFLVILITSYLWPTLAFFFCTKGVFEVSLI